VARSVTCRQNPAGEPSGANMLKHSEPSIARSITSRVRPCAQYDSWASQCHTKSRSMRAGSSVTT